MIFSNKQTNKNQPNKKNTTPQKTEKKKKPTTTHAVSKNYYRTSPMKVQGGNTVLTILHAHCYLQVNSWKGTICCCLSSF